MNVVRHIPDKGFMVWNGQYWECDTRNTVYRLAEDVALSIQEEAYNLENAAQKEALRWAKTSLSKPRLDAMVSLVRHQEEIQATSSDFDAQPHLLTVRNGTVDLQTGKLKSHNPSDLITKMIDVPYVRGAAATLWLTFLSDITKDDEEYTKYLQRAVGYSLSGETKEQVFFYVYGPGGNGKTTFLTVLKTLLGDLAKDAAPFTFRLKKQGFNGPSEDIARLAGSRMVIVSELSKDENLDEAKLKAFTGGDSIAARFLYNSTFEYRPQGKIWMQSNFLPKIEGQDDGIWRRVHLIPFLATFSGNLRDVDLLDTLTTEQELIGILAWAIQGAVEWYAYGLQEPESLRKIRNDLRLETDPIRHFLEEECEWDQEGMEYSARLYNAYQSWCEENGYTTVTQVSFVKTLRQKGYEQSRNSQGKYWKGLWLKKPFPHS